MLPNIVHSRLSERCELKCVASRPDKQKIRISEDANLGCQNDCLMFNLEKIYHIILHMFEKETRGNNFSISF